MAAHNYVYHRIILNVITVIVYIFLGLALEHNLSKEPENPDFITMQKLKYRFTSIYNVIIQSVYVLIALYADIQTLMKKEISSKLKYWRCKLFNDLVFPLALETGFNFWGIYLIDENNMVPIKPSEFLKIFTKPLMHLSHTYVVIYVILELLLHPRECCKKENSTLKLLGAYSAFYACILCYTRYDMNIWIYVVLTKYAGTPYFFALLIEGYLLAYIGYKSQWWIKDKAWQMRDVWVAKKTV